jgi:tripartite-type tricarboxylate transporter receptor subunit TctC
MMTELNRRIACQWIAASLSATATPVTVCAQTGYPSRTVTVVSPFAPGGLNDMCARAVAKGLQQAFAQPVIVENRPGANTLLAMGQVARSAPDGHLLVTCTDTNMVYLPTIAPKQQFSLENDFAPITLLCAVPTLLIVRPGLQLNSVADLIAAGKAQPGKLTFASAGVASVAHIAGELFKWQAGVNMVHIPYRGAILGLTDVISGHVDLMFADLGTASELITAGRARAVGMTWCGRASKFPDVPTFDGRAQGLRGPPLGWRRSSSRNAGQIIRRLNKEIVASMHDPSVGGVIANLGAEIVTNSPDDFEAMIVRERTRFAQSFGRRASVGRMDRRAAR